MSTIPPQPNDDAAMQAASDVIESATANMLIEMQMNKAVRVGTMLRLWRELMLNNGESAAGSSFPENWVDSAAMDIFHSFFPPPNQSDEEDYDGE